MRSRVPRGRQGGTQVSRTTASCLMVGVCVALLGGVCQSQLTRLIGPERETILYDGDLEVDSGGIAVTTWGSGEAEPVYEEAYVGPQVLKVTSHGLYQGVVLHFARPGDLKDFLASDAGYLDLRIHPAQTRSQIQERQRAREEQRAGTAGGLGRAGARGGMGGGGRGGGMRGGMGGGGRGGGMRGGMGGGGRGGGMRGGMGGGGGRGGGMRGGMGGGGMRGGMGGGGGRGGGMRGGMGGAGARGGARAGAAGAQPTQRPGTGIAGQPGDEKIFVLKNLRVVLFTDQGVMIADSAPVGVMQEDKRGWTRVAIPLSEFKGVEDATNVRAVGVFAGESDVFYLGRVGVVVDRRPVEVIVTAEPSITRVDRVIEFSAELRGGPINPEFSWDFDDSDGIDEDAVGREVKYLYKEPGDYLATCTVRDRGGVQQEAVKTIGIRVEDSA